MIQVRTASSPKDEEKDDILSRHPKEYAFSKGTLFDGYGHEKLLSHVVGYKKIVE